MKTMNHAITAIALLSILVSICCCGGGGGMPVPDEDAPIITAITPLTAQSGQEVTFQVTYTGIANDWQWTFGNGATPSSSRDRNPTVTLGAEGIYNCKVVASNPSHIITCNFRLTVTP